MRNKRIGLFRRVISGLAVAVITINNAAALTTVTSIASEIESSTSDDLSDNAFDSNLHTVISENTDVADWSVYSESGDNAVTAVPIQVDTVESGLAIEQAFEFNMDSDDKLWLKADISDNAELDDRESIAVYSLSENMIDSVIIEDITSFDELYPVDSNVTALALVRDTGLRDTVFEIDIDPNSQKSITLEGMCPVDSVGTAEDVTNNTTSSIENNKTLLCAYDISINDGEIDFQPNEEYPISVKICDPRITGDNIALRHITDDGIAENIEEFEYHEGEVSFEAHGFSVYQIVTVEGTEYPLDTVEPSGTVEQTTASGENISYPGEYVYQKVQKNYVDYDRIVTVNDLNTAIETGKNGFYISCVRGSNYHRFAKDHTKTGINGTANRTGLDATYGYSYYFFKYPDTTEYSSVLAMGVNNGAAKFYFEPVEGKTNTFYIKTAEGLYCYNDSTNSMYLSDTEKTEWIISDGNADGVKIKNASANYYWESINQNNNSNAATCGFAAVNNNTSSKFTIWYSNTFSDENGNAVSDPYSLEGTSYGLVNQGDANNARGILADVPSANSIRLGALRLGISSSDDGEIYYHNPCSLSGWNFEWVESGKYKVWAYTDSGRQKKYIRVNDAGTETALVDPEDATAFEIAPDNTNGRIKLCYRTNSVNKVLRADNENSYVTNDANNAYYDLYLVTLPDKSDALGLGGNSYGIFSGYNTHYNVKFVMDQAYSDTKLRTQSMWATWNGNSAECNIYKGGVTKWDFEHIEYNRYYISSMTSEGKKYLRVINNSVTLSDEPFALAVIPTQNEADASSGSVFIYNPTERARLQTNNGRVETQSLYIYNNGSTKNNNWELYNSGNWTRHFHLIEANAPITEDPLGLDGKTYGIVTEVGNKGYAMMSANGSNANNRSSQEIKVITDDQGKRSYIGLPITEWTFHWAGYYNYLISCTMEDGSEKYLRCYENNNVTLVDRENAVPMSIITGTGDYEGKVGFVRLDDVRYGIYCNTSNYSGNGNGYAQENSVWATNQRYWHTLVEVPENDDPYDLDGKTYGIAFISNLDNADAYALMADDESSKLMTTLAVRDENGSKSKVLYVTKDSDVTQWTFTNIGDNLYRLQADNGKYLKLETTGIDFADDEESASVFSVFINSSGQVTFYADNCYIAYNNGYTSATARTAATNLYLVEYVPIEDFEQIAYSAERISVSDGIKACDSAEVIVYTNVWNEKEKRYDYYAIAPDGSLVQCYIRGDKVLWLGSAADVMTWKLTVYTNDDGSENGYYELYNEYSGKYIAPQISGGQILSDKPIGIQMPGRKYEKEADGTYTYGEYYTDIIAWDTAYYDYAGLKNSDDNSAIISAYMSELNSSFYFAIPDEVVRDDEDELHEVATIDNNEYGITMKCIDFEKDTRGTIKRSSVFYDYYGDEHDKIKGRLTTNLTQNADGTWSPKIAKVSNNAKFSTVGKDFGEAFADATEVNHLFIESIYNATGYFEFDSTQNTATLVNADGEIGNEFTVYQELSTYNSSSNGRKHGQFFIYNTIKPGLFSSANPYNLTDAYQYDLPDSDPRKYEKIHLLVNPDGSALIGEPNLYFGMQMDASFIMTPNGLDRWGHDIIFEFKGDDDFWLYIDGELVIDLGSPHWALEGKVNFRTGEVIEDKGPEQHKQGYITTSLYEIFKSHYEERGLSEDEITTKLDEIFEEKTVDGKTCYVFKDYTKHDMRIYYMESDGGDSNIYMKFNLSSVTPGNVLLNKQLSGSSEDLADVDYNRIQYPFQVYYKTEENGDEILLGEGDQYLSMTYQNSTQTVRYEDSYTSPNNGQEYKNVFFIYPNRNVEIKFPDDAMYYRVAECAVNSDIYDAVTVNGEERTGQTGTNDIVLEWAPVKERTTAIFDNHVKERNIRKLKLTKNLYADKEKTKLITDDDGSRFSFRLYLTNGSDSDFEYADLQKYYVSDPDGKLCSWNAATQSFVSSDIPEDNTNQLTAEQLKQFTFHTSRNGAISNIPAGYSVIVPGLPAGTKFKVEERENENPVGYKLIDYQRDGETYFTVDGKDNIGIIRAGLHATINVNNVKGIGLEANKIWSDKDYVNTHGSIYTAVYIGDAYVDGTLREIKSPDTYVRYFFEAAESGKSLDDYMIYEVTVDSENNITPLRSMSKIKVEADEIESDYIVSYEEKIDSANNAKGVDIINSRKGGISISLYKWDSEDALAGGEFDLYCGDEKVGTYTSSESGIICMIYRFEEGQTYRIEQTKSPTGYLGLEKPISFKIVSNGGLNIIDEWKNENDTDTDTDKADGKYWAEYYTDSDDTIAQIEIYNIEFLLKFQKADTKDHDILLQGAEFALYKEVRDITGTRKANTPLKSGLITDADGVIPEVDSSLPSGKYYLTETKSPKGYALLEKDIIFEISNSGEVTLLTDGYAEITRSADVTMDGKKELLISVFNKKAEAKLTINKEVTGSLGDKSKDFSFTLEVAGAAAGDKYTWTKNGVAQSKPLISGGTFTLAHGDSVVITLPTDVAITISEDSFGYDSDFEMKGKTSKSTITFTLTEDATINVINSLDAAIPTGFNLNNNVIICVMLSTLACITFMLRKKYRES